jgi:uncharacterized protein YcbX
MDPRPAHFNHGLEGAVNATQPDSGAVIELWRYPVKSMMGEELTTVRLSERGLVGDRAFALVDGADGKVATAKNPRKWPTLFAFRASLDASSIGRAGRGSLRITLPDGTVLTNEMGNVSEALSSALGRKVTLASIDPTSNGAPSSQSAPAAQSEEYWPDMEGLDHRDMVTDFALPAGTFFDCATVHLLTTATLDRLRDAYPQGRFEVRRFRPNIVVRPEGNGHTFVEDSWIGRTLAIGDEVRLNITGPCGRCVMTTLAQDELPNDAGILRTAVQSHGANVGVYASVVRGGTIRQGDRVTLRA